MQALTAPVGRSIAVAAIFAGLAFVQPVRHRLVLHAYDRPHALYLTHFAAHELYLALPAQRETMVWKTRALIDDGCEWLGTETLVPLDAHRFSYDYRETILWCEPDAVPDIKTPRTGIVTVDE